MMLDMSVICLCADRWRCLYLLDLYAAGGRADRGIGDKLSQRLFALADAVRKERILTIVLPRCTCQVVLCCCHEVRDSDVEREMLRKRCLPRGRCGEEAETGEELSSAGCLMRRTSRLWLTPHQNACMAIQCWAFLLP